MLASRTRSLKGLVIFFRDLLHYAFNDVWCKKLVFVHKKEEKNMKLISYRKEGKAHFGAVSGDGVVELTRRFAQVPDLASFLANRLLVQEAREIVETVQPDYSLSSVQLEAVIPNPGKVICVGINYVAHAEEAGRKVGEFPVIFQRFAETLLPHGEPLVRPKVSEQFDFEA